MTESSPPRPPAGWYVDPDGSGSQRWFDGSVWTEFLQPVERAVSTPPGRASGDLVQPAADVSATSAVPSFAMPTHDAWASGVERWSAVLAVTPTKPTLKAPMMRAHPSGFAPRDLVGMDVPTIGSAWGQPSWWAPEPATGGAHVGWLSPMLFTPHLTADGTCDKVLTRTDSELELSWRLRCLGNVLGRPMRNVEGFLGMPNHRSSMPHGGSLLQWHRPGYHIALRFSSDKLCEGITSQHMQNPRRV
jgi:hypothetical protein